MIVRTRTKRRVQQIEGETTKRLIPRGKEASCRPCRAISLATCRSKAVPLPRSCLAYVAFLFGGWVPPTLPWELWPRSKDLTPLGENATVTCAWALPGLLSKRGTLVDAHTRCKAQRSAPVTPPTLSSPTNSCFRPTATTVCSVRVGDGAGRMVSRAPFSVAYYISIFYQYPLTG
jgi:hypothetical protein